MASDQGCWQTVAITSKECSKEQLKEVAGGELCLSSPHTKHLLKWRPWGCSMFWETLMVSLVPYAVGSSESFQN